MLFCKELKKVVPSISFAILLVVLIVLPVSQDIMNFGSDIIREPVQGENYGIQTKEIPEIIMPAALQTLMAEFSANHYVAYPIGFYKTVKLNDADRAKMAEIVDAVSLNPEITYEQFCEYMKEADKLIGGGSQYSESNLLNLCYVPITYEEAKENYVLVKDKDKFTGTYARYFCDYLGIVLSFLPVFIGVAICLKDNRAKMSPLVDARKTSSFKLIMTRYLAILTAIILPTLILAYISNMTAWGNYEGFALDCLAPLKYVGGWLLPSVMISAAVGMFLTELTGTPIAIAVQGLWWFIDLNIGAGNLSGGFRLWQLTPRHNTLGKAQVFIDSLENLMANRLMFAGIALCLVLATAVIYEQKRRGKLDGYEKVKRYIARLADRKSKSAA